MCTLSTRHANKERNMRVSLSSTGPSTDALAKIFQLGVAGFTVEKLFTAVVAAVVCLVVIKILLKLVTKITSVS